jgi:putative cell wall-binding protein
VLRPLARLASGLPRLPRRALCVALLLAAALAVSGCSLKADNSGDSGGGGGLDVGGGPVQGPKPDDAKATQKLGLPIIATRNTTRVAGADPVTDAAGVATALFPATEPTTRPTAVALVDKDDWQGIVAAGVLSGAPLNAPLLLTDGDSIPAVTQQTLNQLKPKGTSLARDAQTILVGEKPPPPDKLKSAVLKGKDPYEVAQTIDRFATVARGKPSRTVMIASGEQPDFAIPAAAWAARSGDPVLFAQRDSLPAPTVAALKQHDKPHILLLGPPTVISTGVEQQLGKLGKVTRIGADNPIDNALQLAKSSRAWHAVVPGQNLAIANVKRPGDAAAAAGLGANGIFAPLLLTDKSLPLPRSLEAYLLDIQPGFQGDFPTEQQGVYNHAWILGGEDAVAAEAQDRIDAATALVPVDQPKQ